MFTFRYIITFLIILSTSSAFSNGLSCNDMFVENENAEKKVSYFPTFEGERYEEKDIKGYEAYFLGKGETTSSVIRFNPLNPSDKPFIVKKYKSRSDITGEVSDRKFFTEIAKRYPQGGIKFQQILSVNYLTGTVKMEDVRGQTLLQVIKNYPELKEPLLNKLFSFMNWLYYDVKDTYKMTWTVPQRDKSSLGQYSNLEFYGPWHQRLRHIYISKNAIDAPFAKHLSDKFDNLIVDPYTLDLTFIDNQ
ncbi:MAG: hypothetical protein ACXVCP_11545 [Bdellovibrio sp.]